MTSSNFHEVSLFEYTIQTNSSGFTSCVTCHSFPVVTVLHVEGRPYYSIVCPNCGYCCGTFWEEDVVSKWNHFNRFRF